MTTQLIPDELKPVTIHHIPDYLFGILEIGMIKKLDIHRFCYYCQGWSLAINDVPMFIEDIQAGPSGPESKELFTQNMGKLEVCSWAADPKISLSNKQKELIKQLWDVYGNEVESIGLLNSKIGYRARSEYPWINARKGMGEYDSGDGKIIELEDMKKFFRREWHSAQERKAEKQIKAEKEALEKASMKLKKKTLWQKIKMCWKILFHGANIE